MDIKVSNAQYFTDSAIDPNINIGIKATIDTVEMFVPLDPANRHYKAIQEWIAEGNTIAEAD